MSVVTSSRLVPPHALVKDSKSVVIVSMKRPLCVYFDRVMDLVSKSIVAGIIDGKKGTITLTIAGCGGSIARCQQVARYAVRGIREKFKHQVKSVVKQVKISESAVDVVDYVVENEGDDVLDISARTRPSMPDITYLRVSTADPEVGCELDQFKTPRTVSPLRRVARYINSFLQISSPAYNHNVMERKLSFGVFLVLFACFLFTCIYAASMGDMCSSFEDGIARVKMDRDRLAEEVSFLKAELAALRNTTKTT